MSFSNPTALWGLLGLLVPIAIHLFNAHRGRRLAFGDTRFIESAQAQRMRQVFPTEWWLLVLRCALLATLVLILAQPRLDPSDRFEGDAAVLISPLALASAGESALITAHDIAAQHRTELRVLVSGLPRLDDVDRRPPVSGGAWSLLAQFEEILPAEWPVVLLVAADDLESGWRRPRLERPVSAIDVVDPEADPPLPIRVAVDAGAGREIDAHHVQAAMEALWGERPGLVWSTPDDPELELLFRLGDSTAGSARLIVTDSSTLAVDDTVMQVGSRRFGIKLASVPASGIALLETGDGRPVASLQGLDGTAILTWHSRFHPEAAGVVADGDFPDLLASLLLEASPTLSRQARLPLPAPQRAWTPGGWIVLLAALWLGERWLATRRPGRVPNGA